MAGNLPANKGKQQKRGDQAFLEILDVTEGGVKSLASTGSSCPRGKEKRGRRGCMTAIDQNKKQGALSIKDRKQTRKEESMLSSA